MPSINPQKINTRPTKVSGYGGFRALALVLALVLSCQALWLLAAELSRPAPITFPTGSEPVAGVAANRSAARTAAQLAILRGDLWAQSALTYSDVFSFEGTAKGANDDPTTVQQARDVAERALSLAPHDARIWLVLADIVSRFDWLNGKASAALRMSYYTGQNEIALIPSRLLLSVTLPAISDRDFQALVAHDLRTIVNRKPELKPAILKAYRYATPEGQQFIRDTVKGLDPNLLSNLQQNRTDG
jgi:hypothetical protein